MSDTVEALWVGYPGEGPDRTIYTPGETVREIPRAEAEASDYWRIVRQETPAERKARVQAEKDQAEQDAAAEKAADDARAAVAAKQAKKREGGS